MNIRKSKSGKFIPKNKEKYKGNYDNIIFRSLWERSVLMWCDNNEEVIQYSSEEIAIPYVCSTDGKRHRYFIDFWIKFKNGKEYLIEVKPKYQTVKPNKPKRNTKKYVSSLYTWEKNKSKWVAAIDFAKRNNMIFAVWTEQTLSKLGIRRII